MFFVKLGYGLGVTVIGLVVVFFALAILIALIMGMTKFFDKSKKARACSRKARRARPGSRACGRGRGRGRACAG